MTHRELSITSVVLLPKLHDIDPTIRECPTQPTTWAFNVIYTPLFKYTNDVECKERLRNCSRLWVTNRNDNRMQCMNLNIPNDKYIIETYQHEFPDFDTYTEVV